MPQSKPLQCTILQIPHVGVKLRHAVADRRAGCKSHTPAASQLIKILAFGKHVGTLLRFCLGDSRYIVHFGIEKKVLIVVRLVHKEPVHTKLLKRDYIIFPAVIIQLLKPCIQGFLCLFHLFDGIPFPAVCLCECDRFFNLIDLLFNDCRLSLA